MPARDLHDNPFDDSTVAKLEIFEDYATAWLPTFVMSGERTVCVFDFFAGTGYDKRGVPGSPIRILNVIKKLVPRIFQKQTRVQVYFNEYKRAKFETLQESCEQYLRENADVKRAINLELTQLEFDKCFTAWYPIIQAHPCLVYLDQNGIKFLSNKYFQSLEKTTKTDFLYFVSSSYFIRFGDREEFKRHFAFDLDEAKKDPYTFIHRSLLKQLKKNLPTNSALKLFPFSLKKGSNIHGIIFGAKSLRAVEKFLAIAWRRNETNGEANFDIDDDQAKSQLDFFTAKRLTKIERFEKVLEQKVQSEAETSNADLFIFTLEQGHPPKHAADLLRRLKKQNKIYYDGLSPKITFEALAKAPLSVVTIKWIGG